MAAELGFLNRLEQKRGDLSSLTGEVEELFRACQVRVTRTSTLKCRWLDLSERLPLSWIRHDGPERSTNVLGEPCRQNAVAYHSECLSTINWSREGQYEVPLKVTYHLRMLAVALGGEQTPLVTVVLTDRGDQTGLDEALASCLDQSYSAMEILVVGPSRPRWRDSSHAGKVQWIRANNSDSKNRQRNLGLRAATGELVHFLDSDHRLVPNAIEDKVHAFQEIPDARLCITHCDLEQDPSTRVWQTPHEDGCSPLGDAMLAAVTRHPFHLSTVMVPRWFLGQAGEFEEDVQGWEEVRYAFCMARAGLKVVALARPATIRQSRSSESRDLVRECSSAMDVDLRCATDLLSQPRMYRYLAPLISRMTRLANLAYQAGMDTPTFEHYQRAMGALEEQVGSGLPSAEGLTALLLDQCLGNIRRHRDEVRGLPGPVGDFLRDREDRLQCRLAELGHVTGADMRRWLPDVPPAPFSTLDSLDQAALAFALEQLQEAVLFGDLEIPVRTMLRVGVDFPGHPYEENWNGLGRLTRVLGDEAAKRMFRQKIMRYGWQWLGQASRLFSKSNAA